jgi:hypothetical protein
MTATDARQPDDPLTPAPSGSTPRAQPVPLPPWQLVRQWQTARPGAKEAAGLPVKRDGTPSSDWSETDVPTPDLKKAKTETWAGPPADRVALGYGAKPYAGPPFPKRLRAGPVGAPQKTGARTISYKMVNEMVTWTSSKNGRLAICAVTYFEQCATTFKHSKAALNALVGPLQRLENYFAPLGDEEGVWPEDMVALLGEGGEGALAILTEGKAQGIGAVGIGTNKRKRESACALALIISACVNGAVTYTRSQLLECDADLADVVEAAAKLFGELREPPAELEPQQVKAAPLPPTPVDPRDQWAYPMTDRRWRCVLADEGRRCVVRHFPMAFAPLRADYWFHTILNDVHWIQPGMPRKTAWLTANGCTCAYGYGGHQIPSAPFPIWMSAIMNDVMPMCEVDGNDWPNSCNLNLYEKTTIRLAGTRTTRTYSRASSTASGLFRCLWVHREHLP